MSTIFNNNQERSLPLSYRIYSLIAVFLITLMVVGTFFALAHTSKRVKADSSSFTFTAVGDYGQTSNTTAVLQKIGGAGQSFNLAIGDLNYDYPTVTAQQWATYALGNLGSNTFPFEFVSGDHDYKSGKGDLSALETLLPDRLGNISGTYGEQYYFDYPATNSLARFIMVSPVLFPTSKYNYNKGGAAYNWVKTQIEAAKNKGLWVIVGMAEGCIFISSPSDTGTCQDGDLLNLLVSEKVDLVLQAHLHYYAAGNQLALNSQCTSIPTDGSFNKNCVANSTKNMTQGQGTVIVNDGTAGRSLISINYSTDPKAGYFRTGAWDGSNVNKTYGYSQYTISASQISMNFIPVVGSYKDNFTISNGNPTPPPSPSASPSASPSMTPSASPSASPSVTPSSTPGTTIAQDDFQRANQSLWGKASDGINTWGADANNLTNFSIVNSTTGQVTGSGSGSTSYNAVLGASATDAEVVTTGSLSSFGTNTLGAN